MLAGENQKLLNCGLDMYYDTFMAQAARLENIKLEEKNRIYIKNVLWGRRKMSRKDK
jgi:hypothetical protein